MENPLEGYEPVGEIVGIERLRELLPHLKFVEDEHGRYWMRPLTDDERRASIMAQAREIDVSDQPHLLRAYVFDRDLTDEELRLLTKD